MPISADFNLFSCLIFINHVNLPYMEPAYSFSVIYTWRKRTVIKQTLICIIYTSIKSERYIFMPSTYSEHLVIPPSIKFYYENIFLSRNLVETSYDVTLRERGQPISNYSGRNKQCLHRSLRWLDDVMEMMSHDVAGAGDTAPLPK